MSRSSVRRGQTEPLAALVAVVAVAVAVSLYAGAVPDLRERPDGVAETTLTRVYGSATSAGVVDLDRLPQARDEAPAGYAANVSLRADTFDLSFGPPAPPGSANASRPVAVRVDDGDVRRGRLAVEVWS